MSKTALIVSALLVATAPGATNLAAQTPSQRAAAKHDSADKSATRSPGSVSMTISLAGGIEVDVTVAFESASNLSLANVGLSANLIDPADLGLLARLPAGLISIPAAFPVAVLIEPPPAGLLSFDGVATVTLVTSNLPYYDGIRLRLLSAHAGGQFADITDEVSQGSYRVRGTQGEFSEFLIVQDDRLNADVVTAKLAVLQTRLTTFVALIDGAVYASLSAQLADVETHWLAGERAEAIVDLDAFSAAIVAATPAQIPASWAATGGLTNVAGVLRAQASSLRFSLADDPCPATGNYTDTDLDGVPDECDNCTLVANPGQCDTNDDGFGNHCDGDLNDSGSVNFADVAILKSVFLTADPDADLDCSGIVNFGDLVRMKSMWLGGPGPSGIAP